MILYIRPRYIIEMIDVLANHGNKGPGGGREEEVENIKGKTAIKAKAYYHASKTHCDSPGSPIHFNHLGPKTETTG